MTTDRYDLTRLVPLVRQHLLDQGITPPGWRDGRERAVQTYQAEVLKALVVLDGALRDQGLALAPDDQPAVAAACAGWLMGLGVLEPFLRQEGVQEVIVRGSHVFLVHDDGRVESVGVRASVEYFQDLAQRVADNTVQPGARPLSGAWTLVVSDLPQRNARFTATRSVPPTSQQGPAINIRRFTMTMPTLAELVRRGAMSEAVAAFLRQAVAWWGDNQAARLTLGLVYDRAGQGREALETWRPIAGPAAAWQVVEGDSRFVIRQYEEAQERYLLAATLDPASGSAQFGLAEVYRVWGVRQPALAAYEQAKTRANFQPGGRADLAACYFGIGKVYAQDEDWAAAVWQLKAGLGLRPDEDAYRTLGTIYYQGLKDLVQAEAALQQAIALRPDRPYAYELLGYVYLDWPRLEDARMQFETAVELAPNQAEAHAGLAQAYVALGQPDQAIREYTIATQLSPQDPWLFIRLGDVYRDLGRVAEARSAYERALAADSGNQSARRRIEALP